MACVGALVGVSTGFLALLVPLTVVAYRWGRENGASEQRTWWRQYDKVFGGS